MTNRTEATFGECFYDVMCRPTAVNRRESNTETRRRMVTTIVHDPTCTLSDFAHGMVTDRACMVHLTMLER